MRWKRCSFVLLLVGILSPLLVQASVGNTISNIFNQIIEIGSLSFLGFPGAGDVVSLLRILVFILTFTILFAVFTLANGYIKFLTRNITIVISLILSIFGTVFIPPEVLIASGVAYSTLISVILLSAPFIGMLALIFLLPNFPCWWWLVKIIIATIFYWVSTQTSSYLSDPAFTFSTATAKTLSDFWDWVLLIEFLIIIYLIYKWLTCGGEETRVPRSPREFINRIKDKFNPNNPDPDNGNPNGTIDMSPRPPPNNGAKPPQPGPGDDPTPPPNPVINNPKPTPIKGQPYYDPKKPKPPKDKRIQIDLSPWFLSIRNQDGLGACAAFAGSSILEYIINRISGYLNFDRKLSELFLWYNARRNKDVDEGTYSDDLARELLNTGVAKEILWTFEDNSSSKYLQRPVENCYDDAFTQRTLSIKNLANDPDIWIRTLLDEHPIYAVVNLPHNFGFASGGIPLFETPDWSAFHTTHRWHAMVIVGYDSHYPTKDGRKIEAFKLRNSWGSGWCEDGNIWIPRKVLMRMMGEGYIIDGWNNNKGNKQLFTITGRAVFDDRSKQHFPEIPTKETGKKIVHSKKVKAPNDHAFKVAVMAQIKGQPVFLPGAETIVTEGQQGMFKIQFTADATQFERLTHFPEFFPQLREINFSKLPPGVIVVKKPEHEENTNLKEWFFHIVHFKFSHGGRGGEGHAHPENPRSDIATKTKISFSGRPIQLGAKQDTEENVVIPVMFYEIYSTELEEDEAKKEHLAKLALKRVNDKAKEELEWSMKEYDNLQELKTAILGRDVNALKHLDARIDRASRRMYNEFKDLRKSAAYEIKHLEMNLQAKINEELNRLNSAEEKFIYYLQSPQKKGKQRSVDAAKKFLQRYHKEDNEEVKKAWDDLTMSHSDTLKWLMAIVTTLEQIVDLTNTEDTQQD